MTQHPTPVFIDTHCHLDFPEFEKDRAEVIKKAKEAGIEYIINVGSSVKGSQDSVKLADTFEDIYACVGIHPHEADNFKKEDLAVLEDLARNKKVLAIGEIGLDYFKNFSKAENQRPLFEALLGLAHELKKPVVIHTREASADTLSILKKIKPIGTVVHCFSGDEEFLRECLALGFFVSFTCNITYKKAQNLRDLIKDAPLDRIFLETDAPYLSPETLRGKRNEPLNVRFVAEEIAGIKGISIEEVALVTTKAAKEFFSLNEN